jgi:hypothetical protein
MKFLNRNITLISFFIILIIYFPIFYYSTKYLINTWALSDALINYSHGFIRRGFLGELILTINKISKLDTSYIFAIIFILVTIVNIFLFTLILKKISNEKIIYFFLLFNPALILFPVYDTLAYQRKELFVILTMLLHCFFCIKKNSRIYSEKKYLFLFYFIIFPLLNINIFIHDVQFFVLPFHFFLTLNVLNPNFNFLNKSDYLKKKNIPLLFYFLFLIPFFLFIIFPTKIGKLKLIYDDLILINPNVWWDPIKFTATPFFEAVRVESVNMIGNANNLRKYFLLFLFSVGPICLIFYYLKKNKYIAVNNVYFLFFSISPIFLLFFIGRDWGRWLNILNFALLLYFLQFPILKSHKFFIFDNEKILANIFIKYFIIFSGLVYLTFIFIPHCCNHTSMIGGFFDKISLFYNLLFDNSEHIQKTFKNY